MPAIYNTLIMFGIGIPELIIILIVALLVVGPAKLPELARSMGKALGEFRRLADDVKETIEQEMAREPEKEEQKQTQDHAEEQKQGEQQPEQGGDQPTDLMLGDGHIIAQEEKTEEEKEGQKPEGESQHEERQVAEENKQHDLAEKIAEGIRINDPQKT